MFRRDATTLGEAAQHGTFDLVFLDPPYRQGLADLALASLAAGSWLADQAVVVVEEGRTVEIALPPTIVSIDRRDYGDTAVHFLRAGAADGS